MTTSMATTARNFPALSNEANSILRRFNYNYADVLMMTPFEVGITANCSVAHANKMQSEIAGCLVPATPQSAKKSPPQRRMSTSVPVLDQALGGGFPVGLTEVVGPPGVGKTQLCLSSALAATIPEAMGGLNGGVLYVYSESKFPSQRFTDMTKRRFESCIKDEISVLEHVMRSSQCLVISYSNCMDDLMDIVKELPDLIIEHSLRFVVVDSIGAIFRRELSAYDDNGARHRELSRLVSSLKNTANAFNIPIVAVNQISTQPGRGLKPALGTEWAHAVNTRLVMQFHPFNDDSRELIVAKSPGQPVSKMLFHVTSCGISSTEQHCEEQHNFWEGSIQARRTVAPSYNGVEQQQSTIRPQQFRGVA